MATIQLDPEILDVEEAIDRNDHDEALRQLELLRDRYGRRPEFRYLKTLFDAVFRMRPDQEVLADARALVAEQPDFLEAVSLLSTMLDRTGDHERAKVFAREAVNARSNVARARAIDVLGDDFQKPDVADDRPGRRGGASIASMPLNQHPAVFARSPSRMIDRMPGRDLSARPMPPRAAGTTGAQELLAEDALGDDADAAFVGPSPAPMGSTAMQAALQASMQQSVHPTAHPSGHPSVQQSAQQPAQQPVQPSAPPSRLSDHAGLGAGETKQSSSSWGGTAASDASRDSVEDSGLSINSGLSIDSLIGEISELSGIQENTVDQISIERTVSEDVVFDQRELDEPVVERPLYDQADTSRARSAPPPAVEPSGMGDSNQGIFGVLRQPKPDPADPMSRGIHKPAQHGVPHASSHASQHAFPHMSQHPSVQGPAYASHHASPHAAINGSSHGPSHGPSHASVHASSLTKKTSQPPGTVDYHSHRFGNSGLDAIHGDRRSAQAGVVSFSTVPGGGSKHSTFSAFPRTEVAGGCPETKRCDLVQGRPNEPMRAGASRVHGARAQGSRADDSRVDEPLVDGSRGAMSRGAVSRGAMQGGMPRRASPISMRPSPAHLKEKYAVDDTGIGRSPAERRAMRAPIAGHPVAGHPAAQASGHSPTHSQGESKELIVGWFQFARRNQLKSDDSFSPARTLLDLCEKVLEGSTPLSDQPIPFDRRGLIMVEERLEAFRSPKTGPQTAAERSVATAAAAFLMGLLLRECDGQASDTNAEDGACRVVVASGATVRPLLVAVAYLRSRGPSLVETFDRAVTAHMRRAPLRVSTKSLQAQVGAQSGLHATLGKAGLTVTHRDLDAGTLGTIDPAAPPAPRPPTDMHKMAETFWATEIGREVAGSHRAGACTIEDVDAIEHYATRVFSAAGCAPPGTGWPWVPPEETQELITAWGAVLGEVILTLYSGRWEADPSDPDDHHLYRVVVSGG
ncbi:MAG: hypothetical protein FWD57_12460, partial [Polyangiaceae bacterium]|nr:hypothetical protein [Polyangiaceae bacterium]